jgi:hypothetical protein
MSDAEYDEMTEVVLRLERYLEGADLHRSDQITVPVRMWRNLYHGHEGGERPLFVDVQTGADQWRALVARVRPAGVGELEDEHSCLLPDWMWLHLGAPDYGVWITLSVTTVADAGSVMLRPRRTLGAEDDPVALLTAALTGTAGESSWAVLSAGAELPLWCGMFDVVELRSAGGTEMAAGCILDHDVTLELEPALDTPVVRPPSPLPILLPSAPPSQSGGMAHTQSGGIAHTQSGMSFPGMSAVTAPPPSGGRQGFIPFGGSGHTLGSR